MTDHIDVHFSDMGHGDGTLVVVAIGMDVYGATDLEPFTALQAAARKAADNRARRGRPVDLNIIVERGHDELNARALRAHRWRKA